MTPRYRKRLLGYLKWAEPQVGEWERVQKVYHDFYLNEMLSRLKVVENPDSPISPEEWMFLWDSRGECRPEVNDAGRLAEYARGKWMRDLTIGMWREDVKKGLFLKEEFRETIREKGESFNQIFKRRP